MPPGSLSPGLQQTGPAVAPDAEEGIRRSSSHSVTSPPGTPGSDARWGRCGSSQQCLKVLRSAAAPMVTNGNTQERTENSSLYTQHTCKVEIPSEMSGTLNVTAGRKHFSFPYNTGYEVLESEKCCTSQILFLKGPVPRGNFKARNKQNEAQLIYSLI